MISPATSGATTTTMFPDRTQSQKILRMKKRKELGHDFPLISPPSKSRRLEWEPDLLCTTTTTTMMMMMMEEEENAMVDQPCVDPTPASVTNTEEKADLIPGLKDYLLSWGVAKQDDPVEDEMRRKSSEMSTNDSLAVIFHSPMPCEEIVPETGQPSEVEEGDIMEMD